MIADTNDARDGRKGANWCSKVRASMFCLLLSLLLCALTCALLDVGCAEVVDSFAVLLSDWGFYVRLALCLAVWHCIRRLLSLSEFSPQSRISRLTQCSRQNRRGYILPAVILGIIVLVSILFGADSEIVGGVKWRYEVLDGNAIIGRG